MFEKQNGHCAQPFISEFEGAHTQRTSPDSNTVEFDRPNKHCAQSIISQFDDARTQKVSPELNTVVIRAEIHAEDTDAQHIVHFEEAEDFSDTGSLITQAPQSQSIHATINALSSWVSAIQPRESWYLAGWISDSPIEFLVDPGAVVSAISLQSYEKLMEANAILTPMKAIHMELEAANKSDMSVHGMCNLDLSVHGLIINMDALVVDLNCHAILGMDILGDASKLPFILYLVGGTCHAILGMDILGECQAIRNHTTSPLPGGWHLVRRGIRNHTTSPLPGSNGVFCRNNRFSVHTTSFGGDAVGKTKDK